MNPAPYVPAIIFIIQDGSVSLSSVVPVNAIIDPDGGAPITDPDGAEVITDPG